MINRGVAALFAATALLLFTGCFTGIESTDKVKLSRQDKKIIAPGEEERLSAKFVPDTLKNWIKGKKFLVSDSRGSLFFRSDNNSHPELGDTLFFSEVKSYPSPSGNDKGWIVFTDGVNNWEYDTNRSLSAALESFTSLELPMLIDTEYVAEVDKLLNGRRFFVRTSEWYDERGERVSGKKYYPVVINSVTAGNNRFPFKVGFLLDDGSERFLFMSSGQRATDSRSFQSLFLINDIRDKYKHISDETWTLIQNGNVRTGMTKEECRLSLGSPSDVQESRDYSKLIDIWSYGDGKYLRFEDGILVKFKE